ncbi:MAG: YidC/Oxa1 family membrane protein insertase, partial [Pseudomonadota bacterium]
MGQTLYTWLISPLVLIYKSVLAGLMLVVPNYGFALALLAIPHFLMMLPLRRLAETLESRERRIRATLDPQLKVIKDETRGQERHRRTAELYERYSYHPALSLRGSTSILLQVPLLMASFWMVKDIEGLSGSSFGPIADLGEPDRLLSGINALPFVMTLLNVLTIFTTANFAKAERIQGMMLAGLFCLILYSAPSALLIFWTANNLLSLVLNIWPGSTFKRMRRKVPDSKHGLARGPERYPWFGIYILSVLLIGLITTVFGPSALYASDPARYFYRGVSSILGSSPTILIATLIISSYIWRFSSIGVRPLIARGALFCAAAIVLMAVAPFPKYGVLDGPTLSGFSTTTTFQRVAADLLVGAVAFLGTLIVIRKLAPSVIIKAVSLLCGSLILFTLWVAVSHPRDIGKSELGGLAKALRYSEDQQNVL